MKKIEKDFIIKEVRALAIYMVLFAIVLSYLVFYAHISPLLFLVIPLIIIAFTIRLHGQYKNAFDIYCGMQSESWKEQIGKEYAAPHQILKAAYGEVHLLEECVVCRNKRKLLFIPVKRIIKIEERVRLVGVKRVPLLKFTMDGGKPLELDFSARHSKDGEAVILWFIERIGSEKVERSNKAVLR